MLKGGHFTLVCRAYLCFHPSLLSLLDQETLDHQIYLMVSLSTFIPDWQTTVRGLFVNCLLMRIRKYIYTQHSLQWRYNERDGVSNHPLHDFLFSRWLRRRSKKSSKLRLTGLCEGISPVTCEFPAQRVSDAENVSICLRHHVAMHCVTKSQAWYCDDEWR